MSINPELVPQLRVAIVQEAYEWLGTPYVHNGDVKGPRGAADCAMLLVRVFQTVARAFDVPLLPLDFDPRPYPRWWHVHQNEALYMAGMERFAQRVDHPGMGDIAMYKFGKHAAHSAIVVSDELIIHAHSKHRFVETCERRSQEAHLHSYWSVLA